MPIARIGDKQVYFAHIPKCAGSSVEDYLADRFGPLALLDRRYLTIPVSERWSLTSPQHIDWASLSRLFPEDYFDHVFAVVRHPVARAISAFRFQAEVEGTIAPDMYFGAWLRSERELRAKSPHRSDNHSRPQSEFLPPETSTHCEIFHLEHGLEAMIPYFDHIAGDTGSPRFIDHTNKAVSKSGEKDRVQPTADDIALLSEMYAVDFRRFGYDPEDPMPLGAAPQLSGDFLAENKRAKQRAARPAIRFLRRLGGRLRRL